jgi:O-succinylbenzoate synthase
MAELCHQSPLPIALDEELINAPIAELLDTVQPQALVLKPSLHGGLLKAQEWAQQAESRGIRWWVNSALESNIGLTALAEWCAYAAPGQMQALGTGKLFTDDTPGAVEMVGNKLKMRQN